MVRGQRDQAPITTGADGNLIRQFTPRRLDFAMSHNKLGGPMTYLRSILQISVIAALFGVAAPNGAQADGHLQNEFRDSYWVICEGSCEEKVFYYRIHLRDDGMLGWRRNRDDDMVYDGNDRWRISGRFLVFIWTDSTAVEVFEIGRGGRQEYAGPSSVDTDHSVIRRARESGGTMREP